MLQSRNEVSLLFHNNIPLHLSINAKLLYAPLLNVLLVFSSYFFHTLRQNKSVSKYKLLYFKWDLILADQCILTSGIKIDLLCLCLGKTKIQMHIYSLCLDWLKLILHKNGAFYSKASTMISDQHPNKHVLELIKKVGQNGSLGNKQKGIVAELTDRSEKYLYFEILK